MSKKMLKVTDMIKRKIRSIIKHIRTFFPLKPPKQKTYDYWLSKNYNKAPIVSFVIQSHNKSECVLKIINKLRIFPGSEIIVIDDGSYLKHTRKLARTLNKSNEFLFRSNDLYEVITYDRAIYLSRGEFVVLMQDDDDFANNIWIDYGIKLFKKYPNLVILGGRDGARFLPYDITDSKQRGPYIEESNIGYRKNSFKMEFSRNVNWSNSFHFVQFVNRAPMWIRRNLFLEQLKNIDADFAPFQWDDAEICLRAWICGLQVGLYPANFNGGGLGKGGMRIWNNILHQRQDEVNAKRIYDKYEKDFEAISVLVDKLNHSNGIELQNVN